MSAPKEYVFASNNVDPERLRLAALASVHDPATERHLARIGLAGGMVCAEIGPGDGSIARYMAARVGPTGHVVALDINTRFVDSGAFPQIEIRTGDVTAGSLERDTYDVIHARFVLVHLREWRAALESIGRALKPGGWFLVEEPDFRTAFPAGQTEAAESIARVNEAVLAMYSTMGVDPSFGTRLPQILTNWGFCDVAFATDLPLDRGGSGIAAMMGMSISHLRSRLVSTGVVADLDVNAYVAAAQDENTWSTYYATVSAWGRKPPA